MDTLKAYRAAESRACKADVAALRERNKADVAALRAKHRAEVQEQRVKFVREVEARRALAKRRVHDAAERKRAAARERKRTRGGRQPDLFPVGKPRKAAREKALTQAAVMRAARASEVKPKWQRAFIADVWRKLGKPGTLDAFKRKLWVWHKEGDARGKVWLTRAELVGVLGEKRIAESEFSAHGATFHFVSWEK